MTQESNENSPKTLQNRGKITLFKVKELSARTGISRPAIRQAIARGELRCLRVNKRTFLVESRDAAAWIELLSTTQPGTYRDIKAQSSTTHINLLG